MRLHPAFTPLMSAGLKLQQPSPFHPLDPQHPTRALLTLQPATDLALPAIEA